MSRRCERPGCGEQASVSYGFDSERSTVWLEALRPDGPAAGALCRRHADAMVLPRGWWLQDRRSDATLFTVPEPPAPATVYRARRRRRPEAAPEGLLLDRPESDDAAPAGAADGAMPTWGPDFDAGDDLDGLLSAKTPLLARAFRADASASPRTRSARTMPPAVGPSPHCGDTERPESSAASPRTRSARTMPPAVGPSPHCGDTERPADASASPRTRSALTMPPAVGPSPHCGDTERPADASASPRTRS